MTFYSNVRLVLSVFWLLFIAVLLLFSWKSQPEFDSSLIALLPDADQAPLEQKASDQLAQGFENKLVLILSGDNDGDVRDLVRQAAQSFDSLTFVSNVSWEVDTAQLASLQQEWMAFRYVVLAPSTFKSLSNQDYETITKRALSKVFSPLSTGGPSIVEDPFSLYIEYFGEQAKAVAIEPDNGLLRASHLKNPAYVLIITFTGSVFSSERQGVVLERLNSLSQQAKAQSVVLHKSGMVLHAAAGAEQARNEMATIGLGSLIGITLCVLLVFRKIRIVFLLVIPVVIGSLVAAAASTLMFEKVHVVTFAFGAGLVGVAIDYSLHFLCERQVTSSRNIVKKLLPGLTLGLLTSVIAYSAQALAPFPGLRQMAFFSVVGLCSAWVTVVLWFPWLTQRQEEKTLKVAVRLDRIGRYFPQLETNRLLQIVVLVTSLAAIYCISDADKLVDVRMLQTSSVELLEEDRNVQSALGMMGSTQYLLISGETLEDILQVEESIRPSLDYLVNEGYISGYRALSQSLPSQLSQKKNYNLINELYEKSLPSFYDKIGLSEVFLQNAFYSLSERDGKYLEYSEWQNFASSTSWKTLIVNAEDKLASILLLPSPLSPVAIKKIDALITTNKNIVLVDRIKNISALLKNYQETISISLMLAYLAIISLLWLRYKTQLWRVVLPPFVASLIALSIVIYLENGINLFHIMAIVLVVGIGLDMGIFLLEQNDAPHTWLAVSLSCYTSLIAFGLLALSKTPVLYHFGITILSGLLFVWLMAQTVRRTKTSI